MRLAAQAAVSDDGEHRLDAALMAQVREQLLALTDLAQLKAVGRELLLFAAFLADQKSDAAARALYEVVAAAAPRLAAEQGRQGMARTDEQVETTGARFSAFMGSSAPDAQSERPKVKLKDLVKRKING